MNVSPPTGVPGDDAYWQRPDEGAEPNRTEPPPGRPATPPYPGPPRADPPPPTWQPPTVEQLPPPRVMPSQDMPTLDESEKSARTVTYGVGLVVGAIALILMCLLCARVIF